jgi:hypothetical protein
MFGISFLQDRTVWTFDVSHCDLFVIWFLGIVICLVTQKQELNLKTPACEGEGFQEASVVVHQRVFQGSIRRPGLS